MSTRRPFLAGLPAVLVLVAACASAGSASPSPGPSGSPVTSSEQAAALVIAANPRFAGLGALDPELIGQCCWYEVTPVDGGYHVVVRVGWGDCPAGCINKHLWTYAVSADGRVGLIGESGDPLPPGTLPPG